MKQICILDHAPETLPPCDAFYPLNALVEEDLLDRVEHGRVASIASLFPTSWRELHRELAGEYLWLDEEPKRYFENLFVHEASEAYLYIRIASSIVSNKLPSYVYIHLDRASPACRGVEHALKMKGIAFGYLG